MKLKKVTPILCSGLLLLSGMACTKMQSNKGQSTVVNTQSILESAKSAEAAAESLALAGEQLISPVSFMYADMIFDIALENDKNNKRAQFYKAFLKPMMQLKGSMARIKPAIKNLDEKEQQKFNDSVKNFPESALKTFLLDGQEDLTTEEDLLKFLDEQRLAWGEFRSFLKENKDLNFDINVMTLVGASGALDEAAKECHAKQIEAGTFSIDKNCDYLKALKINVSRADIEALQHIASGFQIYLTLYTSYTLDGVKELAQNEKAQDLSPKELISYLVNNTNSGKLRHSGLSDLKEMGTDLIAGTRWALALQDELCPNPNSLTKKRPGTLFSEGLCIQKQDAQGNLTEDSLQIIEKLLAGGLTTLYYDNAQTGQEETAEIRPVSLIENPIADLRQIVSPVELNINDCGKLIASSDKSLGGVFPNNDFNEVLKRTNSVEKNDCQ